LVVEDHVPSTLAATSASVLCFAVVTWPRNPASTARAPRATARWPETPLRARRVAGAPVPDRRHVGESRHLRGTVSGTTVGAWSRCRSVAVSRHVHHWRVDSVDPGRPSIAEPGFLLYRSDRPQQFHLVEGLSAKCVCGLVVPSSAPRWLYSELTDVEKSSLHRNVPKVSCLRCYQGERGAAVLAG
jgi:hypothetical protein